MTTPSNPTPDGTNERTRRARWRWPRRTAKVVPRHALPSGKRPAKRDNTTIALVVVLVLTSGFVAGTTATFSAATRNNGTFTIAGIGTATGPSVSLSNVTATVGWSGVSGATSNANVGYRLLRKNVGGPITTSGSDAAPDCSTGSYSTLTYAINGTVSYNDATVPNTADDQGDYLCYGIEGVFPCCPAQGKNPAITTLQGRAETSVQIGFVVSKWSFTSGNGTQTVDSGEKLTVNFNQAVRMSASNAITATDNLCVDPFTGNVLVGVASAVADSCQNEIQRITFSGNPTNGNMNLSFGAQQTGNFSCASTAAQIQTALEGLSTIGVGNVQVTKPSNTVVLMYFKGTLTGTLANQVSVVNENCGPSNLSLSANDYFPGVSLTAPTVTLGYLSNTGTFTGLPTRYDITSVVWSPAACTTTCKSVVITLGNRVAGSVNTVSLPVGASTGETSWRLNPLPSPAASKNISQVGSLQLCTTDPVGSPTSGLCRPTAASGW
jgi:hypothetical protein